MLNKRWTIERIVEIIVDILVGVFPELKHAQIYVVWQLAYSTELLVCINQAYKQYKQQNKKEEKFFSTQLNSP